MDEVSKLIYEVIERFMFKWVIAKHPCMQIEQTKGVAVGHIQRYRSNDRQSEGGPLYFHLHMISENMISERN